MVKKIIIRKGIIPYIDKNVSCIGYFDGVHLGHQKLINETIKQSSLLNVKASVICFDPDPIDVITSKKSKHLLSLKDRLNILDSFGIDQVIIIKFDKDLMLNIPESFIRNYLNKMNISKLICGFDFSFGYKGLGDYKLLKKMFKNEIITVNEYKYFGKKVSSTRIKDTLSKGNFKLVNSLLGYEYYLYLKVINCSKLKGKWLIEANLYDNLCIMPIDGVYGKNIYIENGSFYIIGNYKLDNGTKMLLKFENYE